MPGDLADSLLGHHTEYPSEYDPSLLFAVARSTQRQQIGIDLEHLPFYGFDLWNHYEVSWLNNKGKPIVATAELRYDCDTPNIVESKSLKLYFNSFNNTQFKSVTTITQTIEKDLAQILQAPVQVKIIPLSEQQPKQLNTGFAGVLLDQLDVTCDKYIVDPDYLTTEDKPVTESVYSHLLKSKCLITNQPDWGSLYINYVGNKINHQNLLKYIVSFRSHNEFHEQCIERIFMDIKQRCQPEKLSIYGRYTRRGGIDINPFRSTEPDDSIENLRQIRQ